MFSFFHRTPRIHVDCFTADNTAYKFAPIVTANKAKPEWFEKITPPQPSNTKSKFYSIDENGMIGFNKDPSLRTLRSCPGFLELYKRGFIIESWCDMAFNVEEDNISYHYSNGKAIIMHKPGQIDPGFKEHYLLKLNSPWHITSKESLPCAVVGAEWSLEDYNFKVLPGMVDYQYHTSTNAFITIRKNVKDQFFVPIGQPLLHFIPLTDKKVIIHNHIVTEEELQTKIYNVTGTTGGWRKTFQLVRRNQKREKEGKCPFGFGV